MIKFTESEMYDVFEFVVDFLQLNYITKNEYIKIKLDDIIEEDEFTLLKPLVGYEVNMKIKGTHKNDSQLVDYKFYFKNPDNIVTEIKTEMCLMLGWNHRKNEEIK